MCVKDACYGGDAKYEAIEIAELLDLKLSDIPQPDSSEDWYARWIVRTKQLFDDRA